MIPKILLTLMDVTLKPFQLVWHLLRILLRHTCYYDTVFYFRLSQKGYTYGNRLKQSFITDVTMFSNSGKLYLKLLAYLWKHTVAVAVAVLLLLLLLPLQFHFFIFCKDTRARVKNQRPIFLTDNSPKMSEFTVFFITNPTFQRGSSRHCSPLSFT